MTKNLIELFMIGDMIRLIDYITEFRMNVIFVLWTICFIRDLNDLIMVRESYSLEKALQPCIVLFMLDGMGNVLNK